MTPTKKDKDSFETSLRRLEKIVEELEEGNVPLEQSLKMYEEGITLSKVCVEKLMRAEQRVKMLARDAEGTLRLFDAESE
jgi:exodeoxyribonuclease VII small subunit